MYLKHTPLYCQKNSQKQAFHNLVAMEQVWKTPKQIPIDSFHNLEIIVDNHKVKKKMDLWKTLTVKLLKSDTDFK